MDSLRNEYISRNQVLNSLVLNTPSLVDSFTTSPKISKVLSFPFGIKISGEALTKLILKSVTSSVILMTIVSVICLCAYTPLETENSALLMDTKSLINKQYLLIARSQEAATYETLFKNASTLSLKDPEEVIHVKGSQNFSNSYKKNINFNKYPKLQFAGF